MPRNKEGSEVALRRRLMLASSDIAYDTELLRKLCFLKARPKAIQYFMESRPTKFTPHEIQKVYRELTQEPGKRGLPPSISDRCIGTTPESRLHTTYIGKKFTGLNRPEMGIETLEVYIKTYEHYLQDFELTVDTAPISFDMAFTIMRALEIGQDVGFVKCEFCKCQFLHPLCTPIHFLSCPTCAMIRTKDPQWGYRSKKQRSSTEGTELVEQMPAEKVPQPGELQAQRQLQAIQRYRSLVASIAAFAERDGVFVSVETIDVQSVAPLDAAAR